LPDEPKLKIRMCVDILAYRSHQPYVQLSVREDWYANLGPNRQPKDVVLETSIAAITSVAWDSKSQVSFSLRST
jgi:hypothetical protein